MQDCNLLLLYSLHFKVSLFDSLVSEQMCPEFQSMYIIPFISESQRSLDMKLLRKRIVLTPGQWVMVTLMPMDQRQMDL